MPPINLLIKPVSGSCNMHCDYCFYCDEARNREKYSYGIMKESTLHNVLKKALYFAERSCTIAFQGGEPTLWGLQNYKKVLRYVEKYNKNKVQIDYALQTNGLNITDEWCEFFKINNFLVGLSIDGIEETHNKYRHQKNEMASTYRLIERTAKKFDKYEVEYNILTVVNKETATHIKDIYIDYRRHGWKYLQFIACLDPLEEERGVRDYSLSPQVYGEFLIQLFRLWYKDWKKGRQPYIRLFDNYIAILLGLIPEVCEQSGVCGIQNVIEADGSIYPCDFYVLDTFWLGNLNSDSISAIYKKRDTIKFCVQSKNLPPECKKCKWLQLCRGGCNRNRDRSGKNYFCKSYRLFFESCYKELKVVADFVNDSTTS